jgi:hypothetical protein
MPRGRRKVCTKVLHVGLRALDGDGRLSGAAVSAEVLEGLQSLLVVDLEMSGPNPLMHEVLDLGGVRAQLAPGLTEEEARGESAAEAHRQRRARSIEGHRLQSEGMEDRRGAGGSLRPARRVGRDAVVTGWGIGQDMAFLAESFRRLSRRGRSPSWHSTCNRSPGGC